MNASARQPVVLIVEDEFLLRMDAAHTIEEAGSTLRHHRRFYTYSDAWIDGRTEACGFDQGRWPPLKIVATSGLVHVREDDLPEGGRFLPKPYRPDQIVATLRELTSA